MQSESLPSLGAEPEAALAWLLQVTDAQFPTGAYAHSTGLEGMVQAGMVKSPDDLETFLHQQIVPSLEAFELPYLIKAHVAANANDGLSALRALDDELEGWRLAAEQRAASRQLGSRRLAMLTKLDADALLLEYANLDAPCHHLIICALELRHLPARAACAAFAYQTISGYTSASMKLMRLGQERSQGILRRAMLAITPAIKRVAETPPAFVGWFNPALEIASMQHARASERLFIS